MDLDILNEAMGSSMEEIKLINNLGTKNNIWPNWLIHDLMGQVVFLAIEMKWNIYIYIYCIKGTGAAILE